MNDTLKNIFIIARKAIYQSYTSYMLMLVGLIFAILGALNNKTFIDKPFYILTIIFLLIGLVLNFLFTFLNLKRIKEQINNLTILKNEYKSILKGTYLYPIFVWNKILKITKNVMSTLNDEITNKENEKKEVITNNIIFETERLVLRHLEINDLETIYKYRNNPDVNFYQTYDYLDKKNIQRIIEANKESQLTDDNSLFAIALKDSNKIIGEIYISYKQEVKEYYIGFTVDKPFQHQGYGYEIVSELLVQMATKIKNVDFICTVYKENYNSIKLIEKLDFKKVSTISGPKGKILIYKKNYN